MAYVQEVEHFGEALIRRCVIEMCPTMRKLFARLAYVEIT